VARSRNTAPITARARSQVTADHDVLERGHVGEQADVLEGPRDPCAGDLVRRAHLERLAVELELASVAGVQPGERVEEGRLARAVRTDQAVDLALVDTERNLAQRLHPAEALGDALRAQQDAHHARFPGASPAAAISRRRRASGHRPAGR